MLDVPLGLNYRGPSPHGEGGLKYVANHNLPHIQRVSLPTRGGWIEMAGSPAALQIALVPPHTGRVD